MTPLTLRPSATPIEWWIIKGDEFDIRVPALDSDNAAVDLTGYTAKAQVRRSEREPLLHEWSAAEENLTIDGTDVVLHMLADQTSAWQWDDALVSVEVYAPITGKVRVLAQGPIHALPQITQ